MLPVTVVRSFSDGNAIRYVLPVSWMTSCCHILKEIDGIREDAYVSYSSLGGGTGGDVYHLRLNLVFECAYFAI